MSGDARYFRTPPWSWPAQWDDNMKIAASYVQTTRHRTTEGLFLLPLEYAATDLGWTPRKFERALNGLVDEGIVEYDKNSRVLLLVMADLHRFVLQIQAPENPNQTTAAIRKVAELPPTPLLSRFWQLAERFSERLAQGLVERFGERLREPLEKPLSNGLAEGFAQPLTHAPSHARALPPKDVA